MKALLCLLIFSLYATANDQPNGLADTEWGYKDGKLSVYTHYTPPWSFKECRGAEIDIIRAAFEYVGVDIHCVSSSYERLVKMFVTKRALFASPVVPMEGVTKDAYFSSSFIHYIDVVASYKDVPMELSDLKDKRIVAYQNAHSYLGEEFKKVVSESETYTELPGREGQIKMLASGRVDYIVGEWNILKHISKKLFPDKTLRKHIVLKTWNLGAASHDKDLMDKFSKGLKAVRKKGLIQKIYNEYSIHN